MRITCYLVLVLMVLCSCTKEDSESLDAKNFFEVGEEKYSISGGAIDNFGAMSWAEGFNFDLMLHSSGISFSDAYDSDFKGTGNLVLFEMISASENQISNGT